MFRWSHLNLFGDLLVRSCLGSVNLGSNQPLCVARVGRVIGGWETNPDGNNTAKEREFGLEAVVVEILSQESTKVAGCY